MVSKITLLGILIILTVGVALVNKYAPSECSSCNSCEESVCVPATCCHPTACVLAEDAPDCSDVGCTEECAGNTMDCGQGYCEYVEGECKVVWTDLEI